MIMKNTISNYDKLFIGINLRRLREKYKLTQTKVGEIIGKSRQAVDHYERGQREISINDLITLSGFYSVSLDILVGNPFSTQSDNTLSFLGFEKHSGDAKQIAPITISTIYDDVICYREDDYTILFFMKSNAYQVDKLLLFDYYDKTYVSKVYYNTKGGGHFYIDGTPKYFNKAHSENILVRGVLMGGRCCKSSPGSCCLRYPAIFRLRL